MPVTTTAQDDLDSINSFKSSRKAQKISQDTRSITNVKAITDTSKSILKSEGYGSKSDNGYWAKKNGLELKENSHECEKDVYIHKNRIKLLEPCLSSPSYESLDSVSLNAKRNKVPHLINQYLRPNAKFEGRQISESHTYPMKVEFKTVDFVNSLVTGYLQISGLTPKFDQITTFFKGEIINNPLIKVHWREEPNPTDQCIRKYSFATENKQWGSFLNNDFEHWEILTKKDASNSMIKDKLTQIQSGDHKNTYIYMRWKEEFLVPDSRVKEIDGASFKGFYYIALNIGDSRNIDRCGSNLPSEPGYISGLYYHKVTEKFQALTLKYIDDQPGRTSGFQFC